MRLTTQRGGEHHVTIPDHSNLRVGTRVQTRHGPGPEPR